MAPSRPAATLVPVPPPASSLPGLDHRSLACLAQNLCWSLLIKPLLLFLFRLHPAFLPSALLLDLSSSRLAIGYFPLPSNKSPRLITDRPAQKRRRIRTATGFKCSLLVDQSDPSIQHNHQPRRLNPRRAAARSKPLPPSIFLPSRGGDDTPWAVAMTSQMAQSDMERPPNYCPEDCLDAGQRRRRFYLVNSFRSKLLSPSSPLSSSKSVWDSETLEDELEPLDDLLDWHAAN